MVKIWNIMDEETEGEKGRKRDISLATSRDLGLVSLLSNSPLARASSPGPGPSLPPLALLNLFFGRTLTIRAKSSPLDSPPTPKPP